MMAKKTNEQFIIDSKNEHGETYLYPLVVYDGSRKPVEIICRKHGVFKQTPFDHLRGCGCPLCAIEKNHNKSRKTTEQFIEEAVEIHGLLYDYSLVIYLGKGKKVEIMCMLHGKFWQTPGNHLQGHGCPQCGIESVSRYLTLSQNEIIERFIIEHGNYYDYSLVVYEHRRKAVEIICPIHGSFWQKPIDHIAGCGCPKCGYIRSDRSIEEKKWLDSLNISDIEYQKRIQLKSGKVVRVDGYDKNTNTIYEYHGKFWHGHPDIFPNRNEIHPRSKIVVSYLYDNTLLRENALKELGYIVISQWS
jgi:ssDNA-binding Zn-finger/Zn-ribbon topoisomerase 1